MKKTMKNLASATLSALTLLTSTAFVHAGSEYVGIQGAQIAMGDSAGRLTFTRTFTLPSTLNTTSTATADAALLQMTHRNAVDAQHAVYINPPTAVCFGKTRDEAAGGNASALVMTLSTRGTDDEGDRFTEHRLVAASRLRPGTNTFMVCARNPSGELTGDIDEFNFGDVVLHFRTTP
jgi:hypothetical protein